MSTVSASFQVPRMSCGSCRTHIENALTPLDGVEQTTVDLTDKAVTVTYDASVIDLAQLVEAIEDAGYPVVAASKKVA
jgi:copper chaperone CopZ